MVGSNVATAREQLVKITNTVKLSKSSSSLVAPARFAAKNTGNRSSQASKVICMLVIKIVHVHLHQPYTQNLLLYPVLLAGLEAIAMLSIIVHRSYD